MRFASIALLWAASLAAAAAPQDQKSETAKETYSRQCAMCHGEDGAGSGGLGKTFNLRDLRSPEVQKLTDAEMYGIIANGRGKMPAYEKNLGEERIRALVRYIRELAASR